MNYGSNNVLNKFNPYDRIILVLFLFQIGAIGLMIKGECGGEGCCLVVLWEGGRVGVVVMVHKHACLLLQYMSETLFLCFLLL